MTTRKGEKSMKKKILALFLSVQLLLSVVAPSFYATADEAKLNDTDPVEAEEELLSDSDVEVTVTSIFPECNLTWTSFSDYLLNQATAAWESPEVYVGYEVEFLPYWDSVVCVSGFENNEIPRWISLKSGETRSDAQIDPSQFKLVIDGYYFEEETKYLWYKIKAADGYVLPEVLEQNPYILYLDPYSLQDDYVGTVIPTFIIGPVKAIFNSTTGLVNIKKQPVPATRAETIDVSQLSPIFSVMPVYVDSQYVNHYDISALVAEYTEYGYVTEEDITILPAEVSFAYEKLLAAEDTYEYYEIIQEIPEEILAQFSEHHRTALGDCFEALEALEQVRYETTVDFGGILLPIVVVGKLPDNVELQASVVPNSTVLSEGFDIKEDFSDIIAALDIKLVYTADGTEWQPKKGRRVGVSIGLGALGYEEGAVVRLQHKHDGFIENYEIAIVQDDFLTVYTSGFSIYTVTSVGDTSTSNATEIKNNGTVTLEIAKNVNNEYIFYFKQGNNSDRGTWVLDDPTGALHYTVHMKSNTSVGTSGVYAPWIKIHPLKVASGIKLSFLRGGNNVTTETYTVNVVAPKAAAGKSKLYIKDDVNQHGTIIAALTDDQGKEIPNGLDGAAFEWSRSDGYFINPTTYSLDYSSVNIALDHGGLVEARNDGNAFQPTTYHLKAILSNGESLEADYTVYYQSEIINADFEFPSTSTSDYYAYFPNGWPELHWKTTAPGEGSKLTMDVEYGYPKGSTGFGVSQAASGNKIAELNAEAFGALYQDVISVPGEEIVWNFSHAPRQGQSWANTISNAMFIVLGPTEAAQTLTANDLTTLGANAKAAAAAQNITGFLNGTASVTITYKNAQYNKEAEYTVWYHDAGTLNQDGRDQNNNRYDYGEGNNHGWVNLEGSYMTPAGQYRTRLFFVSEINASANNPNAGNLIDQARGGQYRKYLIEYHSEILVGEQDLEHKLLKKVEGEALLHSSVSLVDLKAYMADGEDPYYLYKILINGDNYPYNIKYEGDASLYVEKYEDAEGFHRAEFGDYDIVMQIYLRDVATTVQKELRFPAGMTDVQKLSIIQALQENGGLGYQTNVTVKLENSDEVLDTGIASITNRDPKGGYTAYHYFDEEIYISKGKTYQVVETSCTDLPGLKLIDTTYYVYYYKNGGVDEIVESKDAAHIKLDEKRGFAEIVIVNTYEEKTTTIYYKGVGNGKVAFANVDDGDLDFVDTPKEELAFYTGKAIGAKVYPGDGASFEGWFTDEACTQRVTQKDGVVGADNSFKPNANIINDTEVTFYAKFETGSVVIERKNANPGQTFVYCIENSSNNLKMYVTLKCDANGNGTVAILETAATGTYTVTELRDWSWRHPGEQQTGKHQGAIEELKFIFDEPVTNNNWLNGYSDLS